MPAWPSDLGAGTQLGSGRGQEAGPLTGMQLEEQFDSEVVEVTAVLNDLNEGGQATLS